MGFAHVQGKSTAVVNGAGPVGSITLVLASAPTQGNLVAIGLAFGDLADNQVPTISSIQDANNNVYTVSPSSPSTYSATARGMVWLAYLRSAPANASATITVTFASSVGAGGQINYVLFADEFSVGGGAVFITDGKTNSGTSTGNVISSPSILVSGTGVLFYSVVTSGPSPSGSLGIGGSYTHAADLTVSTAGGQWGEYNMNVGPGTIAVNFTDTFNTDTYNTLAMTFVQGADVITQGTNWQVAIT